MTFRIDESIIITKYNITIMVINAVPEKRIFLSIISEYDLKRSICELIDNAIDLWTKSSKINGLIINIADTRITKNKSDFLSYSLSKKSLWEMTKMAALDLAPHFRVNAIAPGAILTPAGKDQHYLEQVADLTPMKTPSGVISILKSIDYIIGNEDLTGQLIFCDGGAQLL